MTSYQIIFKDFFLDILIEIIYFPAWWYSRGLKKALFFCLRKIKRGWQALALSILFSSFFKPMYGQRGWDAYVLSVAIHFFQLIWHLLLFSFWLGLWISALLIWLGLPIYVFWQVFFI